MSLQGTADKPLPDKMLNEKGEMQRPQAQFRNFISNEPGSRFPAETDRYHLYVSTPGSNRPQTQRSGLHYPVTSVHYHLDLVDGWRFVTADEKLPGDGVTPDPLHPDFKRVRDLYRHANPEYDGRLTVPALWDKKLETIVSNESSEIIRMFNTEFDGLLSDDKKGVNLYPDHLRKDIDEANDWIYESVNIGVYKCGFARNQSAYDTAVTKLFEHLNRAESHLASQSQGPYYFGDVLTETDVRLCTTIIRFDIAYVTLFKANRAMIRTSYPHIHHWLRNLYWNVGGFKETTSFEHIKGHYFVSLTPLNPEGIIPEGPVPPILPLVA